MIFALDLQIVTIEITLSNNFQRKDQQQNLSKEHMNKGGVWELGEEFPSILVDGVQKFKFLFVSCNTN